VRVRDAKKAIYEGLRGLSWRRYMCAMWILGGELSALYAAEMSESEASLATATLAVVRDVAASGDSADLSERAAELAALWDRAITEGEKRASGGLHNVWTTFGGIAGEIAGVSPPFYAAGWVGGAVERRWRDPFRRWRDPDEEVTDDSPMAQTLDSFAQVVRGVARLADEDVDPAMVRTLLLGADG